MHAYKNHFEQITRNRSRFGVLLHFYRLGGSMFLTHSSQPVLCALKHTHAHTQHVRVRSYHLMHYTQQMVMHRLIVLLLIKLTVKEVHDLCIQFVIYFLSAVCCRVNDHSDYMYFSLIRIDPNIVFFFFDCYFPFRKAKSWKIMALITLFSYGMDYMVEKGWITQWEPFELINNISHSFSLTDYVCITPGRVYNLLFQSLQPVRCKSDSEFSSTLRMFETTWE